MFNGNKFMSIENDLNLINKKIRENNRNEKNFHYLENNSKRDLSYDIIHHDDNKKIVNLKTNRSNSHKKEIKKGLPNFLYNIDLNKLSKYNNDYDDEKNKNLLLSNNKEKRDISPEKYLEDILAGNEIENNIMISLDQNDNKNILMSNTFKSSKEFDILKNTLFQEKLNMNNLSKSLQITNNYKINQIEGEPNLDKAKIINHDDIPIVVNNTNFMDLLEKELANDHIYNLKYSNKSLDISQNKNSSNLSEKSLNNQLFIDKKENYERDDNDNKEKIKLIKLIKDTKSDILDKRSKTPDNLSFKLTNKRKIFKNNKINFNENIPKINTDKKQPYNEKNIKNNVNNNNNFIQNSNYPNPFQQKKIKNIINNNSITIISHFDIEENSIKKNSDINYNNNGNNIENKDLNDSADKDITNYICEDEEKDKEKKEIIQKKINELNYEINKFKEERNNLNKTKIYYDKLKSKLMSDIEIFNKQKEEFKKYIIDEVEKVKIKQQKYKTNNKIIKNLKNENDILVKKNQESKEIIESLKDQIYQLQAKVKTMNNTNLNNKKINSKLQSIEDINNNNSTLKQQFLNNQYNNKKDIISHRDKLHRNRSSLGMNITNEDNNKIEKRLKTFVTEKEIYDIKVNDKEDDISFDAQNKKQNKKNNLIYEQKSQYSSKTYEPKIFSKRKNPENINKNDFNNIITKENYNNILKLINKSFRKSERNFDDKSFIKKTDELRLNHTEIENKKKIVKCKSNININSGKNNLIPQNLRKKPIKNIDKNINLTNKKGSNEIKQNKLTLEDYEFKIPEKYKKHKYKLIKTLKTGDKLINLYNDNKKEIIFASGVRKEIFEDGYQIVYFVNGDIKQNHPSGKSVYFFKKAKTVQTTFKNGIFVVKFENNQVERHYPDGKKEILYPDGTEKTILDNGNEQSLYSEENSIANYK